MELIIITFKAKNYTVIFCSLLVFVLFFTNAENAISSIKSSFLFCVNSLIPSIFIFMVISSFILYASDFSAFYTHISNRAENILGICRKYIFTVFLCSICGFVNGPKAIAEDYRKNGGNDEDFSNAVILSSNAGIGFLVGCVGSKIWGDNLFGIYLFFIQITSSILLGKLLLKSNKFKSVEFSLNLEKAKAPSLSSAFSKAVTSSAYTIISISAFVIVFSCFLSVFCTSLRIPKDSMPYAIFTLIFEFCQGSFESTSFQSIYACAFATGFCFGFGGLCVHFQTFAVCEGLPLNKFKFIFFKFFHGIVCGLCSLAYVSVAKIEPLHSTLNILQIGINPSPSLTLIVIFAMIIAVKYFFKYFLKVSIDFLEK